MCAHAGIGAEGEEERESSSRLPTEYGATHGAWYTRTLRTRPEPKSRVRCLTKWATQVPLDIAISGKCGVQGFSCFSVSVVPYTSMGKTNDRADYKKSGKWGRLGSTVVRPLLSAQGVIRAFWDRVPHWAPPLGGCFFLSHSPCLCSLSC